MIIELFKSSRLIAVNNIHFQTYFKGRKTGSVQSLEFLKKSWNLPCNFLDLEKVWKIEIKSGKMVKNFFKLQQVLYKWNFFPVGQIIFNLACMFAGYHWQSFVPALFFKVSIAHLFDKCESRKRIYCFGKSLEFWIQKSVQTLEREIELQFSLSNPNPFHISSLEGCIPW